MSYEGYQMLGAAKIMEKIGSLPYPIQRNIMTVDCQPMLDGGILINVMGQLELDDEPSNLFAQTFVLKPDAGGRFFIQHDNFRLSLHPGAWFSDPEMILSRPFSPIFFALSRRRFVNNIIPSTSDTLFIVSSSLPRNLRIPIFDIFLWIAFPL